MKIVNVEDFFHPDAGYQINILSKYLVALGHEVTIITSEMEKVPTTLTSFFGRENIEGRDQAYSNQYGVKILRLPIKGFISGRAIFTKELFFTIQAEKPDVVFVHGNDTLTGMRYLLKYKRLGYPLVMDSHMLEMASTNKFNKLFRRFYKHFFTPMITKNEIPVIRTQDDPYVEKCLGIPLSQCPWISVGSDTMLFHPDEDARKQFREANNISENAFVVIYAGKLDESKGGLLLAETIQKKIETKRDVVFLIVGKMGPDEYGSKVEAVFSQSENQVLRFPTQLYTDLPKFYQAADCAVFPRQCSLSFYDVQACGLPVIFEDNNINIDRAAHENAITFKPGDLQDLRNKIVEMCNLPAEIFSEMKGKSIAFVKGSYDYEDIAKQYCRVIESAVANQR